MPTHTGTRIRRVVLLSLYDLGRQPFALGAAAAFLGAAGHEVRCLDLAVDRLDEQAVRAADVVAVHLPMHTATRLAVELAPRLRALNPAAPLGFFGLYAPMNAELLRGLGADALLGGEFEEDLVRWVGEAGRGTDPAPLVSLRRQRFLVPDRSTLPALERYARLEDGRTSRVVGYTETTRGCRHLCRHCPVVPVYGGTVRAVDREVVLADVAQQVSAGARHITFGDPDFFNGPEHGMRIVRAMHERFPEVTYDVTIKVEHLLRHRRRLPELRATGCLFVTSAVEAVDDAILARLAKGHTRADVAEAIGLMRDLGLRLDPTFVAFTPWTSLDGYIDLLAAVAELGLVPDVAPVQYAIRLLIPAGSRLLELDDVRALAGEFDRSALCHPWAHPDEAVDRLQRTVVHVVTHLQREGATREAIFAEVAGAALAACGASDAAVLLRQRVMALRPESLAAPRVTEPWFC